MASAPASYLEERRPPLVEAMRLEGPEKTGEEAIESLVQKGYFSPRPRPWRLGFRDRGHGSGDFGILDRFGDLVAEVPTREDAEFIIEAVNNRPTA